MLSGTFLKHLSNFLPHKYPQIKNISSLNGRFLLSNESKPYKISFLFIICGTRNSNSNFKSFIKTKTLKVKRIFFVRHLI